MDAFGIGTALKALQRVYFQSARNTGRTMSLVSSLKTGDLVCFAEQREATRVLRMCGERGVTINTMVIDPECPEKLMERGTSKERFVFDHGWVEKYYQRCQERAENQLTFFTQRMDGFGQDHIKTRKNAEEINRWEE